MGGQPQAPVPRLHRAIAAALIAAMISASTACTTTRSVALSPTPPPPEADHVKIVGVETVSGQRYRFLEPAELSPSRWAPEHLIGQVETTYQGSAAGIRLEIDASEIAEYELAIEKKEMTSAGAVGALAFVGIFIAIIAEGMSNWNLGTGAFKCCS